jgi:hypothetical protein
MRGPSIPRKMRTHLLEMGYGTQVTGKALCQMYVDFGGQKNRESRSDLGLGSTLYWVQFKLPIEKVSGEAKFGIKNVYEVTEAAEAKLAKEDAEEAERKNGPKRVWDSLARSLQDLAGGK